jgi:endonuclease G
MSASSIIRAAFFALGAAVGGGAVVAINASKKKEAVETTVEVGLSAGAATAIGPVLKYGNPGMHATAGFQPTKPFLLTTKIVCAGPIFDQLVRRAYVAGYDRRLRHPAWVGSTFLSHSLLHLTEIFSQTAEHLTLASLGKPESPTENGEKGDREKSTFHEDESLPVTFRAKLQDYFRSGYDRGHMCVPTHPDTPPLLTTKL